MVGPRKEHWQVVKCIHMYLKGTSDVGIIYKGNTECTFVEYSYLNYASDLDASLYHWLCFHNWGIAGQLERNFVTNSSIIYY